MHARLWLFNGDSHRIVTEEHLDDRWTIATGELVGEVLFMSRHVAASGKPALTVHPIGRCLATGKTLKKRIRPYSKFFRGSSPDGERRFTSWRYSRMGCSTLYTIRWLVEVIGSSSKETWAAF